MSDKTKYPLAWPIGWPRTPSALRKRAAFGKKSAGDTFRPLSVADGTSRVLIELRAHGISEWDAIISTNLKLRQDGLPRSDQAAPADPGVAVYWKRRGKPQVMAADHYTSVADNLGAIAATLQAMRAIERHGGARILDRAFEGFKALAAPEQPWQVLGVSHGASRADIEAAYRRLASEHHPDRGGDEGQMARINAARDAMLAALTS